MTSNLDSLRPDVVGLAPSFKVPSWQEFEVLPLVSAVVWLALLGLAVLMRLSQFLRERCAGGDRARSRRSRKLGWWATQWNKFEDTIRQKMFSGTGWRQWSGAIRGLASLLVCVLYVLNTYVQRVMWVSYAVQLVVGSVGTVRFLGRYLLSTTPFSFVFSLETMLECLSLPSMLLSYGDLWLNFTFFQAYIILTRFLDLEKDGLIIPKNAAITRLVCRLVLQTYVFVFIVACGLQVFELLGEKEGFTPEASFEVSWFNSFYFTVITIFTVGYGDFVPYTFLGRFWVMAVIVFGAYLVSSGVSEAISAISKMHRGMGHFVKRSVTVHVVVVGNIKWAYLKHFVIEFYAQERNVETQIVVLSNATWTDDDWDHFMGTHPQFKHLVHALEGNPTETKDLTRANMSTAEAVFVLCNPHDPDPYLEDSETLQTILAVRAYNATVPIYSICALRESLFQVTFACEEAQSMDPTEHDDNLRVLSGIEDEHLYSGYFDDEGLESDMQPSTHERRRISRAICMQNVEIALFAENVFCNGLSTLLSNLVFKAIPAADSKDRPWLFEYKIGAEYRMEVANIPDGFAGRSFVDLAMMLYDHQTILLATHSRREPKWKVVNTSTVFAKGMEGIFMTFIEGPLLQSLLDDIGVEVAPFDDELSRTPERGDTDDSPPISHDSMDDVAQPELGNTLPPAADRALRRSGTNEARTAGLRGEPSPSRKAEAPVILRSRSSGEVRTPIMYRNKDLPAHLRRHIIVFVIGEMSLRNMEYLLQRLWMVRPGYSAHCPVVAIHPQFPEEFEETFEQYRGLLFLLNGSSMSIETLRKAQYESALAILVMACEDKFDVETADSRAIFTVMTLDHLLGENASTFVCCTLDAEESLELLRAPAKPRRKGTQLGGGSQPVVVFKGPPSSSEDNAAERLGEFLTHSQRRGRSIRWRDVSGIAPGDEDHEEQFLGGRRFMGARERARNVHARAAAQALAHGTREEIFERQRFASGEMMIASLYTSLLIREYVDPGIMDFIQKITGMRLGKQTQKKKPSWIRLLTIPPGYMEADGSGEVEVTYRRLFQTVLSFGALALGLYRSGTAPVRWQIGVDYSQDGNQPAEGRATERRRPSGAAAATSATPLLQHIHHQRTASYDARLRRNSGNSRSGALPHHERRHSRVSSFVLDGRQRDALRREGELTESSYYCPTTYVRIRYEESPNGENVIPYVYTNPEPYTVVSETDGVFALCHPDLKIPDEWN